MDRKVKIYSKKNVPATTAFELAPSRRETQDAVSAGPPNDRRSATSVEQIADRKVIERYSPPGVIVDDKLEVVQFRGQMGAFLEPTPGNATLSLLKLVHPELVVAVRAAVQKAMYDGVPVASRGVPLQGDRGLKSVAIEVVPLPDTEGRKCALVLFDDTVVQTETTDEAAPQDGAETEASPRVAELTRELAATKDYLQATIEELEATNEELQS